MIVEIIAMIYNTENNMKKVHTADGYDFYIGNDPHVDSLKLYNIVPEGSPPPSGGYYTIEYI